MTPAHVHPGAAGTGPGVAELVMAAASLLAVAVYLAAAALLRRRGDAWPWSRAVSFTASGAAVAWAAGGVPPGGPFTRHMVQHLAVGMAAPLLLVLARPLTLGLRTLPRGPARRGVLAVAHSRPVGWLVFPPVAALLDAGGLWLTYRTGLFQAARHQGLPHAAVHVHMLASGLLFAFAVCQLDPVRQRWSVCVRGVAVLAAGASHAVLAKSLYATPPPGTGSSPTDLHTGAQLMYYGGDLIDLALAATVAVQWYAATGRAHARHLRAVPAAPSRR